MASLNGYERTDSKHTSVLGSEIPLGDWTLALKKRNRAGEMVQHVGVLAAKPNNWSFPTSVWWMKKASVRKLASDLHVDTPIQNQTGGFWHLETRRGPDH